MAANPRHDLYSDDGCGCTHRDGRRIYCSKLDSAVPGMEFHCTSGLLATRLEPNTRVMPVSRRPQSTEIPSLQCPHLARVGEHEGLSNLRLAVIRCLAPLEAASEATPRVALIAGRGPWSPLTPRLPFATLLCKRPVTRPLSRGGRAAQPPGTSMTGFLTRMVTASFRRTTAANILFYP